MELNLTQTDYTEACNIATLYEMKTIVFFLHRRLDLLQLHSV